MHNKNDCLKKLNRLEDYYLNMFDLINVELNELLKENNLTILKRKLVFLIKDLKGGNK